MRFDPKNDWRIIKEQLEEKGVSDEQIIAACSGFHIGWEKAQFNFNVNAALDKYVLNDKEQDEEFMENLTKSIIEYTEKQGRKPTQILMNPDVMPRKIYRTICMDKKKSEVFGIEIIAFEDVEWYFLHNPMFPNNKPF